MPLPKNKTRRRFSPGGGEHRRPRALRLFSGVYVQRQQYAPPLLPEKKRPPPIFRVAGVAVSCFYGSGCAAYAK